MPFFQSPSVAAVPRGSSEERVLFHCAALLGSAEKCNVTATPAAGVVHFGGGSDER